MVTRFKYQAAREFETIAPLDTFAPPFPRYNSSTNSISPKAVSNNSHSNTRGATMNADHQNHATQVSPIDQMLQMMSGFWISRGIYIAAKLGLADHLRDGAKTAAELAAATGAHSDSLHRVLRMLATVGVFQQTDGERFALTPLAETLLTDAPNSLRWFAIVEMGDEHYDAWGNLLHSVRTGEIALDSLFGMSIWQYYEQHPENARNFNNSMVNTTQFVNKVVIEAYDFSDCQKLVDVGGGLGSMTAAILRANPHLAGVVFDAPSVIEKSRNFLAEAGVGERCEATGGDFFEVVPEGGDVYTMRWIIRCSDKV
ncbi:MAG: acetylserotonin O-methyltransferase [Acidobacteriota bacterium]|nr:acetylserotonin O-methyltransferase [Acidobacteriota bacterium]